MSSTEDDHFRVAGPSAPKRPRRNKNACEICRKRKARCDGKQPGTSKCTNCTIYNRECTFSAPTKRYPPGYVQALETKLRKYEGLVQRLHSGQDFTQEVGFKLTADNWMLPGVCGAPEPENQSMFIAAAAGTSASNSQSILAPGHYTTQNTRIPHDEHSSDDDTRARALTLLSLPKLKEPKPCLLNSFPGKSSSTELFVKAFEMRSQLERNMPTAGFPRSRPWWLTSFDGTQLQEPLRFPDPDVLSELVNHYFTNINIFTPILHQQTFEYELRSLLHLRERNFGSVVLLVCALGSRFSQDRRVLVDGDQTWHSAGWKWFIQTKLFDDAILLSTTCHLHVMQAACLATLYASDVSPMHAWMLVGSGIRFAVDIGAHKRRAYGAIPTLEDELYKRSFWALVYFDRTLSANMGRPCSIQEEDFDLDMPLCYEDEYLTRENANMEEPTERPSVLDYFVQTLKLSQIQGLVLRTIYVSTKARMHYNFQGEGWMSHTVAHLDSLMNNWSDSLPDHLRWDPSREDDIFFAQSAHLQLRYRLIQIMIHCPSIAARGVKPLPALPLLICTNAARSITRLAEALHERTPHRVGGTNFFLWTWGTAAMVLLVGIGNMRLSNVKSDRKRAMADVESLLSILRKRQERWPSAVRLLALLGYFMSLGDSDGADEGQDYIQRKRPHRADSPSDARQPLYATSRSSAIAGVASQPQTNVDLLSGVDWTELLGQDHVAGNTDFAFNDSFAQSTGAVLGNIDFSALFGLGDPSLEHGRAWSPAPDNDMPFQGPFQGSWEA